MAYNFGQFRKGNLPHSQYVTAITDYTLTTIDSASSFEGVSFKDVALEPSAGYSTRDGSLFLRFGVKRFERDTSVTIKLIKTGSSGLSTNNTQNVTTIMVPGTSSSETMADFLVYDIIVTPNENYTKLAFVIDRDESDFTGKARAWVPGEKGAQGVTFYVEKYGTITNIIDIINSDINNTGRLKQIGVQSRPGLEMCIDGEMIRVGRSGIYEINHGVYITFIGFMPDENDHFIMDYQY